MKTQITLTQDAYIESSSYRLPATDGQQSVYVVEDRYEAAATDEAGNEYTVIWTILPDWDGQDESGACDWSNPCKIIRHADRDYDASADVEIAR